VFQVIDEWLALIFFIYFIDRDYFDFFYTFIYRRCDDPLIAEWYGDTFFCP